MSAGDVEVLLYDGVMFVLKWSCWAESEKLTTLLNSDDA